MIYASIQTREQIISQLISMGHQEQLISGYWFKKKILIVHS